MHERLFSKWKLGDLLTASSELKREECYGVLSVCYLIKRTLKLLIVLIQNSSLGRVFSLGFVILPPVYSEPQLSTRKPHDKAISYTLHLGLDGESLEMGSGWTLFNSSFIYLTLCSPSTRSHTWLELSECL